MLYEAWRIGRDPITMVGCKGIKWHDMIAPFVRLTAALSLLLPFPSGAAGADTPEQVIAIYPVTSGVAHTPETAMSKVVILSAQRHASAAAAVAAAKEVFRRGGLTVIDETPAAMNEMQGPRRPDRKPTDDPFVAFGKQVGADHVVLIEVTDTLVLDKKGTAGEAYLHDERVSVKGVGVKAGTVALEGTARWSQPIERAGDHLRELTAYAIARAICPPGKWVEASAANNGRGRCRS
jgi:hypothetical protein